MLDMRFKRPQLRTGGVIELSRILFCFDCKMQVLFVLLRITTEVSYVWRQSLIFEDLCSIGENVSLEHSVF